MKTECISKELLKNAAPVTFSLIIITGFFGVLFLLLLTPYPDTNKDFIASLSKTLENILIMAVGFWFGSNSSSNKKDEVIGTIAQQPVAPIAPIAPVAPVAPIAPIIPPDMAKVDTVKIDAEEVTIQPKETL